MNVLYELEQVFLIWYTTVTYVYMFMYIFVYIELMTISISLVDLAMMEL